MKLTRAERIDDLIKASGKDAKQIATEISERYISISEATISDLANSNKDKGFSYKYFVALANYFKVSTDYLLELSDVPTNDIDLQFVCDYTGLDIKTINLLNNQKKHKEELQIFYSSIYENLKDKEKIKNLHIDTSDGIIDKFINLYFDSLIELFTLYIANSEELERGIEDYKAYITIKKSEAQNLAQTIIDNKGNNKKDIENFYYFCGDVSDKIIDNRDMNLTANLTASNSALLELQDTFLNFTKSLYDTSELKKQYNSLISDYSFSGFYSELEILKEKVKIYE